MTTPVGLAPVAIQQFFNNEGKPNVGGSILTQVGGINYPTYQDSAGATPLPNPIPLNSRGEVSNAAGASCQLFLALNVVYTFTLKDANGNLLNQAIWVAAGTDGVNTIADLRNATTATLSGNSTVVGYYAVPGDNGGGTFYVDAADHSSTDNGWSIFVDASGRRWYRIYSGPIQAAWFGVSPLNANNNTALQAFISAVCTQSAPAGGGGELPFGNIPYSGALSIPQSYGWKIAGMSRLGTTLVQLTDNTPHFHFTQDGDWGFTFEDFGFSWTNNQPATNTAACALYFDHPGSGATNFNFTANRINCDKGFRFMSGSPTNQMTVWGWSLLDYTHNTSMSGGAVNLNPTPLVGQPNWRIGKLYSDNPLVVASEYIVSCAASDSCSIDSMEVNQSSLGCGLIALTGGGSCTIGTIKSELSTYASGGKNICDFSNGNVVIGTLELATLTVNVPGNSINLVSGSGTNAKVKIGQLITSFASITGTVYATSGFAGSPHYSCRIGSFPNLIGQANFYLTNYASTADATGVLVEDFMAPHMSGNVGDTGKSVTIGVDQPIQVWRTTLTADRALTLLDPISGLDSNAFDAFEWTAIVNTATPTHNLLIEDSAGNLIGGLYASNGVIKFKPYRFGWQLSGFQNWTGVTP